MTVGWRAETDDEGKERYRAFAQALLEAAGVGAVKRLFELLDEDPGLELWEACGELIAREDPSFFPPLPDDIKEAAEVEPT